MNKPKGGRGKQAPYTTKLVRIPTLLARQVSSLVERYHDYINSGGNPLNPPTLLDNKVVNNLKDEPVNSFIEEPVNNFNHEIETLKAELEKVQQERHHYKVLYQQAKEDYDGVTKQGDLLHQCQREKQALKDEVYQLKGALKSLESQPNQQLPDLQSVRNNALAKLRVGKQAPEYKRSLKAMDLLIDELRLQQQSTSI